MNNFQQIQEKIKALQTNCVMEEIELKDALNRVLREDVLADNNMPPFDKSAMDGYACRLQDIENSLELLEVINAGFVPTVSVGKNQCSKIMTGAKVPEGADCVFKVEESEITESGKIQCTNAKTHKNICYLGEDYKKGEVLIQKGTIINVSHMAVLAGAGYQRVKVTRLPKIAVITTGTELVEPHENPSEGKIRNTNASQLLSQLAKMNLAVTYLGIFADDYDKLSKVFIKAIADNDFVFFTGGASVGDFDWIPKILEDQKFEIFWERTGIKPGNPMTFSKKGNTYCFGLSGNPVSSLIQFEFIAKPTLYKLMGANYAPLRLKTVLANDFYRKKADRLGVVPVEINADGAIQKIPFNGSAHINALVSATALLEFPLNKTNLLKGETAYVRPL